MSEHRVESSTRRLTIVSILEMVVGGIVVLGGAALIYLSIDTTGRVLGIVHATLGFMGLSAGLLLWVKKTNARAFTIVTNALIIAFSAGSEAVLSLTGSLPSGAFTDSAVGTLVAIIIAGLVVVQLLGKKASVVRATVAS